MARKGWPVAEGLPDVPWNVRRAIEAYALFLTAVAKLEALPSDDQQRVLAELIASGGREASYGEKGAWKALVSALAEWLKD